MNKLKSIVSGNKTIKEIRLVTNSALNSIDHILRDLITVPKLQDIIVEGVDNILGEEEGEKGKVLLELMHNIQRDTGYISIYHEQSDTLVIKKKEQIKTIGI
jgi:hypothetical protein